MTILSAYDSVPERAEVGRVERTGVLKEMSADSKQGLVAYMGVDLWLPLMPGMFVIGGLVSVLEERGRPVRVLAAVSDRPLAQPGEDAASGELVVQRAPSWAGTVLEPITERGMTEEEKARLEEATQELADAKQELAAADSALSEHLATLEEKLATEAGRIDAAVISARDAHNAAVSAQEAADEAAQKYGPLDERTRKAQQAADQAKREAQAASESAQEALTQSAAVDAQAQAAQGAAQQAQQAAVSAQVVADTARENARTAQQTADEAAAKYGVLDGRTRTAQSAADVAKQTARAAQATADQVKKDAAALQSKVEKTEADLGKVVLALDGKTAITISTSRPSTSTPGKVKGDLWWQTDMSHNLYGQWTWDGSQWKASLIRNELVASLDVHKLQVTGSARIATAVVNKLYSELIVAKLFVAQRVIAEHMMANGSVTSRMLNVVPENGKGGLQLKPDGLMIVDANGVGAVDLRVNTENYISFYQDGAATFFVSAQGDLTAQNITANDTLTYRGVELATLLDPLPRGIIGQSMLNNTIISGGPWTEICSVSFVPEAGRQYRAVLSVSAKSSASISHAVGAKFSANSTFSRTWIAPYFEGGTEVSYTHEFSFNAYDTGASAQQEVTLSVYGQSSEAPSQIAFRGWGDAITTRRACYMLVEDIGVATPLQMQTMRSQLGDGVSTTTERQYTTEWGMTGFQNYNAGRKYAHTSGNIAGGYYGGEWRGIMFFNYSTIRSALTGSHVASIEIYLPNAHTYSSAGATVLIGSHSYASAPASSPSLSAATSTHFGRGQGKWVPLPGSVATGFATGSIRGLGVYGSSQSNYALFRPQGVKIRATYTK